MNPDSPKRSEAVAVIGAGITGLTVAHALRKAGLRAVVFERAGDIGGNVATTRENGFLIEHGPHTLLLPRETPWPLLQEIGLADVVQEPEAAAKKRYLVRGGRALAMPASPLDFIRTPLFSLPAKLRVMLEPFSGRAKDLDETMDVFVKRHLGAEFLDYALDPFVRGVYAGDARELCLRWAFPRMHELEQQHRSLVLGAIARKLAARRQKNPWKTKTFSFPEGMRALPEALARGIPEGDLRTNISFEKIEREPDGRWAIVSSQNVGPARAEFFGAVVLCVSAFALPELPLPEALQETLNPLRDVAHAAVSVLHQGFRREDVAHPLDGFGMLVSSKEPFEILGTLFSSSTFSNRAPEGHVLLTTYIGGRSRPDLARADEAEQARIVARDTGKLLGVKNAPVFQKRFFYPHAIPQYRPGHGEIIKACERAQAAFPGLFLAGNYRDGVAAGAALTRGLDFARQIVNTLSL